MSNVQQIDPNTPVVILGAGIVGIFTALSLLHRGVTVKLIDKGEPGQATSYGNAGVVSPWSFIPQAMPDILKSVPKLMLGYRKPLSIHPGSFLNMIPWGLHFARQSQESRVREAADAMAELCSPSIELFKKHLSGTGEEKLLTESLYIQAFRDGSKATLNGLDHQIRLAKGADMEVIGQDSLSQIEPALGPEFRAAVVIKGTGRVLSPGRVAAVLAEKARSLGAEFIRAEIKNIRRDGLNWTIDCGKQAFQAERIVVCLGVWSSNLLADFPIKIPLMSERGYHVEYSAPGIELNNSVMDVDAKFIASSMESGLRVAGHSEFAPPDAPPSKQHKMRLARLAKAAFPGLNEEKVSFWMGRRPSFPDSLPMIDAPENHPGLYFNFGHSHFGLMMSPASGELTAQLICDHRPNVNLSAYSAQRFE
ncbi:NAD(P)/FAD-dependent oxidoreductase [Candidatus Puniceispirillum marinum]|nr:FAD-dependent oxidoreductase [Candidatus Puniceispirillum marinum]